MSSEKSLSQKSGVLQRLATGSGFMRDPDRSYQPGSEDIWVSPQLIKKYRLEDGADLTGSTVKTQKGLQLETIETICGLPPEGFRDRIRYDRLSAIDPNERLRLGDSGIVSMRIIDLIAPIGKGTRGLIVSPPKAGKTRLLEEIAIAI